MQAMGVDLVRLSPQPQHMAQVIALFDEVRRQPANAAHAQHRILPLMPDWPCNGFWHGRPGLEQGRSDLHTAQHHTERSAA